MNRKLLFSAGAAACILCLAGCSDDSVSGVSNLCGGTVCGDGEKCVGDRCIVEVGFGGSCSAENAVCIEGTCIDGICGDDPVGNACESDDDCTNGKCVDGVCKDDETGEITCKTDDDCTNGKCVDGVCKDDETGEITCKTDDDCTNGKCVDGVCKKDGPAGGGCITDADCAEGERCGNDGCYMPPGLGQACSEETDCADGLLCTLNGICIDVSAQLGETCDDTERFCETGECLEGICVTKVQEGQACDDFHLCKNDDLRCIDGVCSKILGVCRSSAECSGDSYCCLDDTCKVKNICLPYEDGQIDNSCQYKTVPGLFEAAIQCEWKAPSKDDAYPGHANVLMTPLVMKTPHETGGAQSIIFTTYNNTDGGDPSGHGSDIRYYGVIRIIDGENCKLQESIFDDANHIIGGSNLAMADVDGDGFAEIYAGRGRAQKSGTGGGIVSFHWDPSEKKYVTWKSVSDDNLTTWWGGPSLHDLDGDGIPEVIGTNGHVFNSLTLERLNPGQNISASVLPTAADLDNDGNVEIITYSGVHRWDKTAKKWNNVYDKVNLGAVHFGYADFGTRKSDGTFDFEHLDGIAEVLACGSSIVDLKTLNGESLMRVTGLGGGGPCTVGDFDGDTLPEIATAFGDYYRVFDPRCKSAADGCPKPHILWEKKSQDHSSSSTGSSLFDFDGDGIMEAVYADECYTRVYDGRNGDVLFSAYRSSGTWHEYPVIADVDNDQSAEIIVGSNNRMWCAEIDPIHRGLRCSSDADCKSKKCVIPANSAIGLCRCETNDQCNSRTDMSGNILNEYVCTDGLTAEDRAGGKVCRARRSNNEVVTGVRVMRDRLDRWMSSRSMWNQHVYNITNVNDDMTVPKLTSWTPNFRLGGNLNNLRQNVQGATGQDTAPDITGRFVGDACQGGEQVTLNAVICNRGTKMVSKLMPATFYKIDENTKARTKLCTSYTTANVPIGGCLPVSCGIGGEIRGDIVIVVNDDGNGGRTTVECNDDNNEAEIRIESCPIN